MYRAIIFDFFGVFCPDLSHEWFKKNAADYEALLPRFQEICGRSDRGELSRSDFYHALGKLTNTIAHDVESGIIDEFVLNTDLIEWITTSLQSHYKLAILSNATAEWIDPIVHQYDFHHVFDQIIISAHVGMVKPNRDIFEYTCAQLDVAPSEALFIDDRQSNVDAAITYGLHGLLYVDLKTLREQFSAIGS